ncbi:MAG: glutathione S-transferase family protein [Ancalomicrobiaceae bacterium]|nr:glutathione S-transferase family protein [Ancalomicrobiaceae bacterium]
MAILRTSPASPFGRKVTIAAALLGLSDAFEVVITDTSNPDDPLRVDNPLGKIPALLPDSGVPIYDSRVILEYLDLQVGGGAIIPADPADRIKALTLQALADGIADASLLQIYEVRMRAEEERSPKVLAYQAAKVARGLAQLEANPPSAEGALTVGEIAVACMLGYLDLRFHGTWRAEHPRLVAFLDAFAGRVPAFEATKVQP